MGAVPAAGNDNRFQLWYMKTARPGFVEEAGPGDLKKRSDPPKKKLQSREFGSIPGIREKHGIKL